MDENVTTNSNSSSNATLREIAASDDAHLVHMLAVGYLELLAMIVGVPLNALVIYLSAILARKHQSNNNLWIVFSMTTADLVFTLFHCSLMFGKFAFGAAYDLAPCMFLYITTYVST